MIAPGARPDFLAEMSAASCARAEAARARTPPERMIERAREAPPAPALALHGGFDLIAEVKLRSPAAGALSADGGDGIVARATAYARAGAAAVSVLTEPTRFDGRLAHLQSAAAALREHRVPAMRKDFLVDPYQVSEARSAGAGGVLVILRMLDDTALEAILDRVLEHRMFALLEAFDAADLARAEALVAGRGAAGLLVGVNCRDLATLRIVPERLIELAARLPRGVPRVAESGVASAEDARRVAAAGYDVALVGSALMRAADPRALVEEMLAAGRGARAGRQAS